MFCRFAMRLLVVLLTAVCCGFSIADQLQDGDGSKAERPRSVSQGFFTEGQLQNGDGTKAAVPRSPGQMFALADRRQEGDPIDFEKSVLPILEAKCNRCHGEKSRKGKLDMRTPDLMLKGGNTGPAYMPGNSKKSLMIELIHYQEMPPKKVEPRVTGAEFDLLKAWIDAQKP